MKINSSVIFFNKTSCEKTDYLDFNLPLLDLVLQKNSSPLLVDEEKFHSFINKGSNSTEIEAALRMSRFSFMGTDGMRGKVKADPSIQGIEAVKAFIHQGNITPALIEASTYAFAKLLGQTEPINTKESSFCVAQDGRDMATGGLLNDAMKNGFLKAGFNVSDLGIIPTPAVPLFVLKNDLIGGSMLTASHNPANQNGIKFFIAGSKMLPEGILGDFAFSALLYKTLIEKAPISTLDRNKTTQISFEKEILFFMESHLPDNISNLLLKSELFLDASNGAWTALAKNYFTNNRIPFHLSSEEPRGDNINNLCGVSEIEGSLYFTELESKNTSKIVQDMFSCSKSESRKPIFGIVVDGDGDRGFVLYFDREKNLVRVLNGDISGYIIATDLKNNKESLEKTVVFTIESDIMVGASLAKNFSLKTKTTDIGDKWIATYPSSDLLLGFESSGHIIIPLQLKTTEKTAILKTGNGLFSALLVLSILLKYSKSEQNKIWNSYSPGFAKTFYTYFINKDFFCKNSAVWKKDQALIEKHLSFLCNNTIINSNYSYQQEEFADPNVLYYSMFEDSIRCASLFIRNSGTENKNGVYLNCSNELTAALLPLAKELAYFHRKKLVNLKSDESKTANGIVQFLQRNYFTTNTALMNHLHMNENAQFMSFVLHALIKENTVVSNNGTYSLYQTHKGIKT